MYAPGTILRLRNPKPPTVLEGKGEDGEDITLPFPYNRVRVVNQSPINHGMQGNEWVGANGQGVIITPLEGFDSTIDQPYGRLTDLYEVESIPDNTLHAPTIRVIESNSQSAGETPEEAFARYEKEHKIKPSKDGKRARTPHVDPLTEAGL